MHKVTLRRARLDEVILLMLSVVWLVGPGLWSSVLVKRVLASSDAVFSTSMGRSEAPGGGISWVLFGPMVACREKNRGSLGGLVLQQMEMVNGGDVWRSPAAALWNRLQAAG